MTHNNPVSLTQFLIEEQRAHGTLNAELRLLLEVVARACKRIAIAVNKGALGDVLGTAGTLSTMLPVDLPTLPGFRMPDFKDFNPLAQVANTSGASRADAATALAGYRATISDSLLRGGARISTAAFELSSIAAGLVRNAMAAPAVAASPAGPLGATAFVAGLIADALNNAMQVLEALEKDLHAIAGALTAETSAAMGRAVPGPGPITEKAHGDLQRLASMTVAPAPAAPRSRRASPPAAGRRAPRRGSR